LVTSKGRKVKKDIVLSGPIPKLFKSKADMQVVKTVDITLKGAQASTITVALIIG
jgi:hypothetical protein